MRDVIIEKCSIKEIETLKSLGEQTFSETFTEDNSLENLQQYLADNFNIPKLSGELTNPNSFFYFGKVNNKVVGYMKLNIKDAQTEDCLDNSLELQRIYILKDYKGYGIGSKFMEYAIELAKESGLNYLWLGVWEHNYKALAFYEKHNFEVFDQHVFTIGESKQLDYLMKRQI